MSFFDDVSDMVNSGAAAVQKASKIAPLRFQIGDIDRQRRELATQLGESILANPVSASLVKPAYEDLFASIEELAAQRAAIEEEIAKIEAEAEAAEKKQEPSIEKCASCGGPIGENDKFCCTCGAPVMREESEPEPEPEPAPNAFCTECGSPVKHTDSFCMNCGAKLVKKAAEAQQTPLDKMPEPPLNFDVDQKA